MCVLACRLKLKWSQDKPTCKVFTSFVCVLLIWSDWGGALERVQIFILAEGLKIEFLALSGRETSLVRTFCESCVHLDIAHPSVHMTRRFVIQGCPTLKCH